MAQVEVEKMLSLNGEVEVSIVIPAYNEEKRIGFFLDNLINFATKSSPSYEILVVIDGCTDATEEIVRKYSEASPAIRLITFPRRLGKGGALKLGFRSCRGRFLVYMDADGGYDPKEIPDLLRVLDKADCAVGSRAAPGAVLKPPPPRRRMIAGYFFKRLVNLLLLREIGDTQAGFKAFKREVVDKITPQVSANSFDVDVQLLVRAEKNGFRLTEVPVTYRFVKGSKVNTLKDGSLMGLYVLKFWLRLALERLRLCKIPNNEGDRW